MVQAAELEAQPRAGTAVGIHGDTLRDMVLGETGKTVRERNITWFSSNKCQRRQSAFFSGCGARAKPGEMNTCPIDLTQLIQSPASLLR